MRNRVFLVAVALLLLIVPAGAAMSAPSGTYSAAASGQALEVAVKALNVSNPVGLSLGISAVEARSTPYAKAKGAGQCEAAAPPETVMTLPCTASMTEQVEVTGSGEQNPAPNPKCQSPAIPAQVSGVVNLGTACGNGIARITGLDPFAEASGSVAFLELVSLPALPSGLPPLPPSPKAVDARLGPSISRITSEGSVVKARSDASGGVIVVGGLVQAPPNGQPDGLVIIELGDAFAEASWDGNTPVAKSDGKGSVVTLRVKQPNGTYASQEISPNQSIMQLNGTPLQTTIQAGFASKAESTSGVKGSANANAVAVRVHAAQGVGGSTGSGCLASNCDGGIDIRLATVNAQIEGELPIVPQLATTGRETIFAIAGITGLFFAMRLVRSLRRRPNAA